MESLHLLTQSSSYEPTPINVSTEAATPINLSTEEPKTKKTKLTKSHCRNHRQSATRTMPIAYTFRKDKGDHIKWYQRK